MIRQTSREEVVYNLKMQGNPSGAIRVGDYKLSFSRRFKKDDWYNCSRHEDFVENSKNSMEYREKTSTKMSIFEEEDLDPYDDNDDDGWGGDGDEDDYEDEDGENYIDVDSLTTEHQGAVRKFDRWAEVCIFVPRYKNSYVAFLILFSRISNS
jgi:hypothetical protein